MGLRKNRPLIGGRRGGNTTPRSRKTARSFDSDSGDEEEGENRRVKDSDSNQKDTRNDLLYHGKYMLLVVAGVYLVLLSHRKGVVAKLMPKSAMSIFSSDASVVKTLNTPESDTDDSGGTAATSDTSTAATSAATSASAAITAEATVLPKQKMWEKKDLISYQDSDQSKIEFSKERPLLSLSLPNMGTNILPRYIKCAGRGAEFGRYFTEPPRQGNRTPIGLCMNHNLQGGTPLLQSCGDYSVWHDLQYQKAANVHDPYPAAECFDLVMKPMALEKLAAMYPRGASVILVHRDPQEWYESLSYDTHKIWTQWCNPSHNNAFPTEHTEAAYVAFMEAYQQKVRQFVRDHAAAGWNLIEVDLRHTPADTGQYLETKLGIPANCWIDSSTGNVPLYDVKGGKESFPVPLTTGDMTTVTRPNDISYPIYVASLPKSGTGSSTKYFGCALGGWASVHQVVWKIPKEQQHIGLCYKQNVEQKKPPLEGCGDARVFSDVGVMVGGGFDESCYYPALMDDNNAEQLAAFAKAYPYGTMMIFVRTAESWFDSVTRWYNLHERWAGHWKCQENNIFPRPESLPYVWHRLYQTYVDRMRKMARDYPTLTYIEVPLKDDAGPLLDDIFGMPEGCFTHDHASPP